MKVGEGGLRNRGDKRSFELGIIRGNGERPLSSFDPTFFNINKGSRIPAFDDSPKRTICSSGDGPYIGVSFMGFLLGHREWEEEP